MQATITSKGQVTLPIALRRRLRLQKGDVLEFDESAPFLKATRAFDRRAMLAVAGRGARKLKGKTVKQWMDELRGPVELP